MKRIQYDAILEDLNKKMVFIVGPRQAGKTWLAQHIAKSFEHSVYLNYDHREDRNIIKNQSWLQSTELLILDELHKMPDWKNYLKGLFDTKTDSLRILITGSARLDIFRSSGDSLAGRQFTHHLFPFSPAELRDTHFAKDIDRYMNRGSFPEAFLAEQDQDADRWRMQYIDGLLREDIVDFENIHNIRAIQLVLDLLRERVGSPISYTSIASDVGISPTTVRKYIMILESLYIIFRVTPFSKNIARSLLKESKIYFFDTGMVINDPGKRFENMVAVCLLKYVYERIDYFGHRMMLQYLRTKEGKEVDFCITQNSIIEQLIEAKYADTNIDASLLYFSQKYNFPAVQVVKELRTERVVNENVTLRRADTFLPALYQM